VTTRDRGGAACGARRRRGFGLRPPARRALTGRAEGLTTGRVGRGWGMRGSFFLSVSSRPPVTRRRPRRPPGTSWRSANRTSRRRSP
jgi:hypothetical protein